MKRIAPLVFLALVAFVPAVRAVDASTAPAVPSATFAPCAPSDTKVILVRHGEKRADQGRDPALTAEGRERALDLSKALHDAGIEAVLVTQFQRTGLTAKPLADELHLTPEVFTFEGTPEAHVKAVAESIKTKHAGQVVLVVGHSNTLPGIAAALGAPKLPDLGETDYDNLFIVVLTGTGKTRLIRSHYGRPFVKSSAEPAGKMR